MQNSFALLFLSLSPVAQWSLFLQFCQCGAATLARPAPSRRRGSTRAASPGAQRRGTLATKTNTPEKHYPSAHGAIAPVLPRQGPSASAADRPSAGTQPDALQADAHRGVSISTVNLNSSMDASAWRRDRSLGADSGVLPVAQTRDWSASSPHARHRLGSPSSRAVNMATLAPEPRVAPFVSLPCVAHGVCCRSTAGLSLTSQAWLRRQRLAAMVSLRAGDIALRASSTYQLQRGAGSAATFRSVPSFSGTAMAGQRLWGGSFAHVAPGSGTGGITNDALGATHVSVPCEACGEACEWAAGNACSLGLIALSCLLAGAFAALLAARAECETRGGACDGALRYTYVFLPVWALVLLGLGALLSSLLRSAARFEEAAGSRPHRRHSARHMRHLEAGSVLCLQSAMSCGADGLDLALHTPARVSRAGRACRERSVLLRVLISLTCVVQLALVFATLSAGAASSRWVLVLLPLWGSCLLLGCGHVLLVPPQAAPLQLVHRSGFIFVAVSIIVGAAMSSGSWSLDSAGLRCVSWAPAWAVLLPSLVFMACVWTTQARAVAAAVALRRKLTGHGATRGAVAPAPSVEGVRAAVALSTPSLVPGASAAAALSSTKQVFIMLLSVFALSVLHVLQERIEAAAAGASWYIVASPLLLTLGTLAVSAAASI